MITVTKQGSFPRIRRRAGDTKEEPMSWVLILITLWVAAGIAVALVIGRGIRLADDEDAAATTLHAGPDDEPAADEAWPLPGAAAAEGASRRPRPSGHPAIGHCIPAPERAPTDRERGLA
ncbi:hypothetical protein [Blastococcus sp. SYSU DS0828]